MTLFDFVEAWPQIRVNAFSGAWLLSPPTRSYISAKSACDLVWPWAYIIISMDKIKSVESRGYSYRLHWDSESVQS